MSSSESDELNAAFDTVLAELHANAEDEDAVAMIGIGPLESLFHGGHEAALWPRIEQLARVDPTFRSALAHAWAYSSPMFDRRVALLRELEAIDD